MDNLEKLFLIIIFLICVFSLVVSGFFSELIKNDQNPAEYHVANSSFKIYNWWSVVNSTNDSVEFTNYYSVNFGVPYEIILRITQYSTDYQFESKYKNSSSSSTIHSVKTENKSISGIQVRFINITDTKTNYTLQDYFFQKNGKYYSIHLDLRDYESYYDTAIKLTIKTIISTIY
jgi:hypothetical protein